MTDNLPPPVQTPLLIVKILDLSGASVDSDNIVEEVKGFEDLSHANAFARAYVRDSVERCRVPGASEKEVLAAWFTYGEDAEILTDFQGRWHSSTELNDFVARPASLEERDWRSIDPRRKNLSS